MLDFWQLPVKVGSMAAPSHALEIPPEYRLGPAMKKLNDKQKLFVVALMEYGGISYTRAAMAAGYTQNEKCAAITGHRLAHDEDVIDAIQEEARRRLQSGQILAVSTIMEICADPLAEKKDRIKAAEALLNRTGMPAVSEQKVAVTHRTLDDRQMIKKVTQLAKSQGLDPAKLLGDIGITIDAEFAEVLPAAALPALEAPVEDDLADIF